MYHGRTGLPGGVRLEKGQGGPVLCVPDGHHRSGRASGRASGGYEEPDVISSGQGGDAFGLLEVGGSRCYPHGWLSPFGVSAPGVSGGLGCRWSGVVRAAGSGAERVLHHGDTGIPQEVRPVGGAEREPASGPRPAVQVFPRLGLVPDHLVTAGTARAVHRDTVAAAGQGCCHGPRPPPGLGLAYNHADAVGPGGVGFIRLEQAGWLAFGCHVMCLR